MVATLTPPTLQLRQDFESAYFIPSVYNKTYYSNVMQDEEALIHWKAKDLHDLLIQKLASLNIDVFPSMYDAGSGPSVHHLFSLAKYTEKMYLADFLPANLKEIKKWHLKDFDSHNWTPFVMAILEKEGELTQPTDVRMREAEVRKKINAYELIDLKKPVKESLLSRHMLVTSFFVADSSTSSKNVFMQMTKRAFSIVSDGGVFVASYLGGCTRYRVGSKWLASASITEQDIHFAFEKCGAKRVTIWRFETPEMAHDGFSHIYAVVAEK